LSLVLTKEPLVIRHWTKDSLNEDVQLKLATVIKPQNLEEKVVWYYIIGTYGLYFLGAQFVVAPVAWLLVLYLLRTLESNRSYFYEEELRSL